MSNTKEMNALFLFYFRYTGLTRLEIFTTWLRVCDSFSHYGLNRPLS